jgi:hypothetical protein
MFADYEKAVSKGQPFKMSYNERILIADYNLNLAIYF